MKLAAETLSAWAIECLQRSRVSEADAHCLAESLVQTSLWGIDSHGIARLTHYLNRLAHGSVNPAPQIVVTRSGPATAQVATSSGSRTSSSRAPVPSCCAAAVTSISSGVSMGRAATAKAAVWQPR